MQAISFVIVNKQVVKVLARPNISAGYVALKLRETGRCGMFMADESEHLETNPQKFQELLAGKVVKL
jgi:hypothetical protein